MGPPFRDILPIVRFPSGSTRRARKAALWLSISSVRGVKVSNMTSKHGEMAYDQLPTAHGKSQQNETVALDIFGYHPFD